MKLQLPTKKIKIRSLLSLLMGLAVLLQIYLAYVYLYPNLNVSDDLITTRDIVRVDLKSYDETITLLNQLETYQPPPLDLPRTNPFR